MFVPNAKSNKGECTALAKERRYACMFSRSSFQ